LAVAGAEYWALVAKPIVTALAALGATLWLCRWWPGKPVFDAGVRHMVRFGANVTAFTLADFVGRNVDRVGLGYFYGPRSLGFYDKALSIYESCVYLIAGPLHSVATASLSKLRDDPAQFRARYADAIATLAFFAVPAFAFLALAAGDLVVLLMGEKWSSAGMLLSIVALCGPAHIVERSQGWLHVAAGRADRWARWGLISSVTQVIAVACGLPFGAEGVAWAYTICIYALFAPCTLYAGRPVGLRLAFLVTALARQFVAGIVAGLAAWLVLRGLFADASSGARIAAALVVCAVVYLLVVLVVLKVRRPVYIASTVARDLLPSRLRGVVVPIVRWSGEQHG
jgi:PST family polysaccharide transporter